MKFTRITVNPNQFDGLLQRMQAPKARKGMKAAFNASPAKLGRAAVRAAAKKRQHKSIVAAALKPSQS